MKSSVVMVMMLAMTVALAMASVAEGACSSDLTPYKPCMPAVLGTSPPLPTSECCKVVKDADFACICTTVASMDIPALNQEAAFMLPKRCGAAFSVDPNTCKSKPSGILYLLYHHNTFVQKKIQKIHAQ